MNITLVGPSSSQRGGIASVLNELKHFLLKQDIKITLIATTSDGNIINRLLTFLRAWLSIIIMAMLRRTDIVHIHMSFRGSCLRKSLLGFTCWIFKTPYIIHLHSGGFHNFYHEELGCVGRALVNFVFRRASEVIAISRHWQKWLEDSLKLKHVALVFNGVSSYANSTNKKSFTILFLGRLGANKGTDELIEAMRELTRKVPSAVLELGGDGNIEAYRQLAADLPNVQFLGWVDDAGRRAALARATVYCLPSWNEGLPMSVLEAMSAGIPVVSTPVGGIPEALEDGITGLLVQPGDVQGLTAALCKLLLDPELATSMGKAGQARYREMFSTEAMGQSCLEVYKSCLKQ